METDNFENKIREELQQREIKPSEAAWHQLSAQLDKNEEKKASKLWWASIAAAVVIGFFVGFSVFENSKNTEVQLVEEQFSKPKNELKNQNEVQVASEETEEEKQGNSGFEKVSSVAETIPLQQSAEPKEALVVNKKQPTEIVEVYEPQKIITLPVAIENKQVAEVAIEENRTETERLLAQATATINSDFPKNPSATVSASRLLQEVEEDLDQSFRNQVYEVIKEGVIKARTAVASRNY